MSSETFRYALIMLAAGIGISVLAALNAQLGNRIGSPVAAATILFAVAFFITTLVLLLTSGAISLASALAQPLHLFLGGFLVAFYVLSVTWIAPRFGVGNAIFCVLLGQMIAASVIDQFGLFGAIARPISLARGSGIACKFNEPFSARPLKDCRQKLGGSAAVVPNLPRFLQERLLQDISIRIRRVGQTAFAIQRVGVGRILVPSDP
jgi:transporter family-2 protein